jgi:hypothetical protein
MDDLLPVTSAMQPTPGLVGPEGFAAAPEFMQQSGFQHGGSALSAVDAAALSQPGWQPAPVAMNTLVLNEVHVYQPGSLAGFDSSAPALLGYWQWQSLGLGHPMSWEQQAQLEYQGAARPQIPRQEQAAVGQGGVQHHLHHHHHHHLHHHHYPELPGGPGSSGRIMASEWGESSSASSANQ